MTPNGFIFTQRLVHFQPSSEKLLTVDANLTQRPTIVNMQKIEDFVVLSSKWVIYITSFLPRLRTYLEGDRKTVNIKCGRCLQEKDSWAQRTDDTNEVT